MKRYGLYLNGRFESDGGDSITVFDPSSGEAVAEVATVDRSRVTVALVSAQAAFAGWRALPAIARADYLLSTSAEMLRRADEIARVITLGNGKPLAQSRGEVAMSIDATRIRLEHQSACLLAGRNGRL